MNRYFGRTAAAGCLVGLASVCLAISGAHALDGRVSVAADMHIGPGANYPVVSSVPADVDVRINGCTNKDGWCAVRYDGRHGWVPSASACGAGWRQPFRAWAWERTSLNFLARSSAECTPGTAITAIKSAAISNKAIFFM